MREVCASTGNGSATPGYRVKKFIDAFPNHSTYSICQNDFSEAMRRIGEKIRATVGPPCVDRPLVDIDPMAAGLQVDCNVQERMPNGNGQLRRVGGAQLRRQPGRPLLAAAGMDAAVHGVQSPHRDRSQGRDAGRGHAAVHPLPDPGGRESRNLVPIRDRLQPGGPTAG